MKVTKRRLRRIIREQLETLEALPGEVSGVGVGQPLGIPSTLDEFIAMRKARYGSTSPADPRAKNLRYRTWRKEFLEDAKLLQQGLIPSSLLDSSSPSRREWDRQALLQINSDLKHNAMSEFSEWLDGGDFGPDRARHDDRMSARIGGHS